MDSVTDIDWFTISGAGVIYMIVLIIGCAAARMTLRKNAKAESAANTVMIGFRDFGWFISICTISATWIGSGATVGCAERTFQMGVIGGALFGIGYAFSLLVGAFVIVDKIRENKHVSFAELFQEKYGRVIGSLFAIPAFVAEQLCVASSLTALGATLAIMANIADDISIVVSGIVAITYTFFGGIFSVAYTDVIQLAFVGIGLAIALPFVATHDATDHSKDLSTVFFQSNQTETATVTFISEIDRAFLPLVFGGVAWQCYIQRLFATRTSKMAKYSSVIGCFVCIIYSSMPLALGAMARSTGKIEKC